MRKSFKKFHLKLNAKQTFSTKRLSSVFRKEIISTFLKSIFSSSKHAFARGLQAPVLQWKYISTKWKTMTEIVAPTFANIL